MEKTTLGKFVQSKRKQAGLSQKEVAKQLFLTDIRNKQMGNSWQFLIPTYFNVTRHLRGAFYFRA